MLKHGHARKSGRHPLYATWMSMKDRCNNPSNKHFDLYGGRGISICERWSADFAAFLSDMGDKPSPRHSIDRVDVNGAYAPENCRWATPQEQARNQRKRRPRERKIMIDGETAEQVAERCGVHVSTIRTRVRRGITGADLMSKDMRGRHCIGVKRGPRDDMERDASTQRFKGKRMNGTVERR